jgi:hypothetical protein
MTDPLDLRDIERRATTYWNVDGLPELMMGLLWLLWGGSMLVGQTLPRGTVWNLYWMFTPALLVLSGVAANWMTKKLKARITFPRAGYVEWNEPTRAVRLATAAVAVISAAALAALVARSRVEGVEHIAAPGFGVILSLAFLVISVRQRAPYHLAMAGVALMLGLAFGALKIGWDGMNWMLVVLGIAEALIGSLRLRMFLRRNPLEAGA